MIKINGFTIDRITLAGFKNFSNQTELSCDKITKITGHNGCGKSSVADAIAFAITGTTFFGESRLDRLYAQGSKSIEIILDITDDAGNQHKITRQRANDKMTIIFDGVIISQANLNSIFTDRDTFLSMFNPLYFINTLGEKGKKLLYELLPYVPQKKILETMSGDERNVLENLEILSPEAYTKKVRDEIAELKSDITYFEGQRDQACMHERDSNIIKLNVGQEILNLRGQIDALKVKRFDGIDIEKYQRLLNELIVKYDFLVSNPPQANPEPENKLNELQKQLAETGCKAFISEHSGEIASLNVGIKSLLEKYKEYSGILTNIAEGGECPYCIRPITANDIAAITAKVSEKMNAIKADGAKLRAKLKALEKTEIDAKSEFDSKKTLEIERLSAEIDKLKTERESTQAEILTKYREELNKLEQRIEAGKLTVKQGKLSNDEYEQLQELEKQLIAAEGKEQLANSDRTADKKDYGKLIEDCENKIKEKTKLITYLEAYALRRAELTFSAVKMNKAEIKLYDVVKSTGEVKETFKFTYDGIPYNCLSLSETIRAGAEVCELIKRITGFKYPTFYDNMESVADIKNVKPTGQTFVARFVNGAELSVNGRKPRQLEAKEAA